MIQVPAHKFKGSGDDAEVDSDLKFAREQLVRHVTGWPAKCGLQVSAQFTRGCTAYQLGRADAALELLTASCEVAAAMFAAVSASPESKVTFSFSGSVLSGPSGPTGFGAGCGAWLQDVMLAVALRRTDVMTALTEVPVRVMERAGEADAFFAHLAYATQAFLIGENPLEPLAEFDRLIRPENVKIASPKMVSRFAAAAASLRAIAGKDQTGFDESLVAQLKAHKKAHERGDDAARPDGLIDRLSCGMAVLGQERGLQLNVESGYMPPWLVGAKAP
jgi:hypothetical protein